MSKHAHNQQDKHHKDTKEVLQEMQEARKTIRTIQAELVEHNSLLKLHPDESGADVVPDMSNTPAANPVIKLFSGMAPKEIRYGEEQKKQQLSTMREVMSSLQACYFESFRQWAELPFQITSAFFQECKNTANRAE